MKKVLLYGNGSFINLGCEAIARGTCKMLSESNCEISMATYMPEIDNKTINSLGAKAVKLNRGREGLDNIIFEVLMRLKLKNLALKIPHFNAKKVAKDIDISMAVGGDNYCYEGFERYFRLNKGVRKSSKKNVFLACSIEPSFINEQMIHDLNGYDAIYARETITYEALKKVLNTDVKLCSDPAFLMTPDYSKVPDFLNDEKSKFIGVNLSPLIYKYSTNPEVVDIAVVKALQRILDNTDYNLFFFPHVYGEKNDVYINKEIATKLNGDKARIILFEDRINANSIKGIISKLKGVICARTHASIASYSSLVPTFVLGYSVKAKGIAKDIYGDYNGHIIPVQELIDEDLFANQIENFVNHLEEEGAYLEKFIPEYSKKAKIDLGELFNGK